MGLVDLFASEDRAEIKISDIFNLMREATKAEVLMNGAKCDTPHAYMREMMTGKREEAAHVAKEIPVHVKPVFYGIDIERSECASHLLPETPGQESEKAVEQETDQEQESTLEPDTKESED